MKALLPLLVAGLLISRAASAQTADDIQDRRARIQGMIQRDFHGESWAAVPVQYQTSLPPPIPLSPIQAPGLSDAAAISARENALIAEFRSNVEHDPLSWAVPLRAVPPVQMLPRPVPEMRAYEPRDLVDLRRELNRLKGLLAARGITISIQGMTCSLGAAAGVPLPLLQKDKPVTDSPGEGTADEIAALIVSIAGVQRRIAEVQGSVNESELYRSCVHEAGVTAPPPEIISPPAPLHEEPLDDDRPRTRYVPPEAPIQDKRPPCEPETEYFNDHILVPRQAGFNSAGEPVYNEVWQTIQRERPKYKPGC